MTYYIDLVRGIKAYHTIASRYSVVMVEVLLVIAVVGHGVIVHTPLLYVVRATDTPFEAGFIDIYTLVDAQRGVAFGKRIKTDPKMPEMSMEDVKKPFDHLFLEIHQHTFHNDEYVVAMADLLYPVAVKSTPRDVRGLGMRDILFS